MKKSLFNGTAILIATLCAGISTEALAIEAEIIIKEQPHHVYHVIKDKTLLEAVKQIAGRSGFEFKVATAVESDKVTKKLAADNWNTALMQLLEGFNYSTVIDKGKIKSVIITGRNGSGKVSVDLEKSKIRSVSVKDQNPKLPSRYQNLVPGSVMPVKLPMSKIAAVALGKKILLDLPIGQYRVNHDDFVDDGNGAMTWMGYLEDEGKGYRVFLSQGEAGIIGNITTPDGSYELETVNGRTYLVDQVRSGLTLGSYDKDQVKPEMSSIAGSGKPGIEGTVQAALAGTGSLPTTTIQTSTATTTSATASTTTPVVDIMVLYTTVNQTATYAKQRIKYLVNITNRAYQDSFINMRLRLVHTRPTSYAEKSTNNSALSDLANNRGAFANISALRTQYGADLVLLLRPYYVSKSANCGIAYVGFSGGSGAYSGSAYGAISDGKSKEAPTNYYCGVSTFAHEVGHTLGNVHDRAYAGFPGKFSYSYAWGINNKFGTIMSYYGPSLMLFATPKLPTQCAGVPCGYAAGAVNSSDQSRTINYTAPLVAKYKPKTITTPVIQ